MKFITFSCLLVLAILSSGSFRADSKPLSSGCKWGGPTADWMLSRRLPAAEISGLVGADVVLSFLQGHGLPVSFISKSTGDVRVRLKIANGTTLRELLETTIQQAPGYRYGIFDDRVVVYPVDESYDTSVMVALRIGVKRARALSDLLHALRGRTSALHNLDMHIMRGMGKETIYGDEVDIGGTRSIIEHLVSLIQKRPSAAFELMPTREGHLYYDFQRVTLVQKLALLGPSKAQVGETFAVLPRGTLSDGTIVALEGPECYVKYGVTDDGVLTVGEAGQVFAKKAGSATISIQYEDIFSALDVKVRDPTSSP